MSSDTGFLRRRSGMYRPPPADHAKVASSKFVELANGSKSALPSTDERVKKYDNPAVPFRYGRTIPLGSMTWGPTPNTKMLLLVLTSTLMRPNDGLSGTRFVSCP